MKLRTVAELAVGIALTAIATTCTVGCGTLNARVGHDPAPPGIDQQAVELTVCLGQSPAQYIEERGGSNADITERVARSIRNIEEQQLRGNPLYAKCCSGPTCPNSPAAAAAKTTPLTVPPPSPPASPNP